MLTSIEHSIVIVDKYNSCKQI